VINVEVNYLNRAEDLVLIEGAADALRLAQSRGWALVVITNQAGVARGYFSLDALESIHDRLIDELGQREVALDGIYVCTHHPNAGCDCRKPQPGMILKAAEELHLDLGRSWMIGDRETDLDAGRQAGCRVALVLTGYGATTLEAGHPADLVAPDLRSAIACILDGDR
jgi:D,D-heptose 1,7-bisphosphate phosphatase